MLIKIFKTNYFLQLILIFLISTLLWLHSFANPEAVFKPAFASPLYNLLYDVIRSLPIISVVVAAFVLVICEGFLVNFIFTENGLIPKTTLLPAFIYILLMSYDHVALTLTPVIIVNLFLILGLRALFQSAHSGDSLGKIYISSLLFSMATLFYLPALIYWLLIIIVFIIYKSYHWREWFVSILGFLAPFLFVATFLFLTDELFIQIESLRSNFRTFPNLFPDITLFDIPYLVFVVIFFTFSVIALYSSMHGHVVFFRKKCNIIMYYLLLALILFLSLGSFRLGLGFFSVPFSLLFCLFLFGNKKLNFYNIVLMLFILFSFINVYIL